jgi:hypothetical protein
MALYVISASTSRTASPEAIELRTKATRLEQLGETRALKILNGFASHFLAMASVTPELSAAERREHLERAIARFRACGAPRCVAFLERLLEGTHG